MGFCSACLLTAQENYSLWPRRPAELEQAQALMRKHEYEQVLTLLEPFVNRSGLAGREARRIIGSIRVRRYLSANHPRAKTHTVKRGENIERIATANKCSSDLLILINALRDPSSLKIGQKLTVYAQDLRAELHLHERELSVWDGRELVAVYDVAPTADLLTGANEETTLREREGELNGARIARTSPLFTSCNRSLRLADGTLVTGGTPADTVKVVRMQQSDANELSLLLGSGARVSIVRDNKSFDPFGSEPADANH